MGRLKLSVTIQRQSCWVFSWGKSFCSSSNIQLFIIFCVFSWSLEARVGSVRRVIWSVLVGISAIARAPPTTAWWSCGAAAAGSAGTWSKERCFLGGDGSSGLAGSWAAAPSSRGPAPWRPACGAAAAISSCSGTAGGCAGCAPGRTDGHSTCTSWLRSGWCCCPAVCVPGSGPWSRRRGCKLVNNMIKRTQILHWEPDLT